MLKLMFQPRIVRITSAMAYMFTPLIRIVMSANETAERARAPSPNRSWR
jgi:hypothetical protein